MPIEPLRIAAFTPDLETREALVCVFRDLAGWQIYDAGDWVRADLQRIRRAGIPPTCPEPLREALGALNDPTGCECVLRTRPLSDAAMRALALHRIWRRKQDPGYWTSRIEDGINQGLPALILGLDADDSLPASEWAELWAIGYRDIIRNRDCDVVLNPGRLELKIRAALAYPRCSLARPYGLVL